MSEQIPSIPLYTKALISELSDFGNFKKNRRILLVEGIDDNVIINKYRFYKGYLTNSFEISISEGKRNVLDHKEVLKDFEPKIACLLDYDYSPLLKEVSTDQDVFHYPYFELENLLFSDEILKKVLNYYVDCSTQEVYNYFIEALESFEQYFIHQIKLKLFIDVNHRTNVIELSSSQRTLIKHLINTKISSIIKNEGTRYKGKTPEEKLDLYYSEKLSEIGIKQSEIDNVISSTCENIFDYSITQYNEERISKLKYFVDGKLLVSDLNEIIKFIHFNNYNLKPLTLKKNPINDINHSLMNDWIPTSNIFDEILTDIKRYLDY